MYSGLSPPGSPLRLKDTSCRLSVLLLTLKAAARCSLRIRCTSTANSAEVFGAPTRESGSHRFERQNVRGSRPAARQSQACVRSTRSCHRFNGSTALKSSLELVADPKFASTSASSVNTFSRAGPDTLVAASLRLAMSCTRRIRIPFCMAKRFA